MRRVVLGVRLQPVAQQRAPPRERFRQPLGIADFFRRRFHEGAQQAAELRPGLLVRRGGQRGIGGRFAVSQQQPLPSVGEQDVGGERAVSLQLGGARQFAQRLAGFFALHIADDTAGLGIEAKIGRAYVFNPAWLLQNVDRDAKLARGRCQHVVDGGAVGKFGGISIVGDAGDFRQIVAEPVHRAIIPRRPPWVGIRRTSHRRNYKSETGARPHSGRRAGFFPARRRRRPASARWSAAGGSW